MVNKKLGGSMVLKDMSKQLFMLRIGRLLSMGLTDKTIPEKEIEQWFEDIWESASVEALIERKLKESKNEIASNKIQYNE